MGQSQPIKPTKKLFSKRSASRPAFEVRLSQAAKDLEKTAWQMPPGPERDGLLRKARQMDVANHINGWLSSPGLAAPK
jgi:hypothetical protein